MYLTDYLWFLGAIVVCMIISIYASRKVSTTYARYDKVKTSSGMTGFDTAVLLLKSNQIEDIKVGKVSGTLTDHFDPTKGTVNLSDATYQSNSVAAVAVAAHELGHVMQKKRGYLFYNIRTALVPVVNFGARLAMPLVLIGLMIDLFATTTDGAVGFYIALSGVILYGSSFLFTLVTLPVEFNASRRAKKMLVNEGVLTEDELQGASKVLSAAALTYLSSMLVSLVYFLRFFVMVLTIFGRRNRK